MKCIFSSKKIIIRLTFSSPEVKSTWFSNQEYPGVVLSRCKKMRSKRDAGIMVQFQYRISLPVIFHQSTSNSLKGTIEEWSVPSLNRILSLFFLFEDLELEPETIGYESNRFKGSGDLKKKLRTPKSASERYRLRILQLY